MSATLEDLASRLRQLEHHVQELAATVTTRPPAPEAVDLADRISFRAWMKLSAPTFGILLVGFTLLWNAQQASSAQMLEMTRTLGRLDGTVAGLEATTARLDQRLFAIDERLASFDARLASFDDRLASFDTNLVTLNRNVERLGRAVEKLEAR